MPDDNLKKLYSVFADLYGADANSLTEDSSQETIDGWDSIGMVHLINELEGQFGVSFEILEIADFKDIRAVKNALAAKGVAF
ncbi:MAG: acyl carrier protein [Nitrospinae bacterium]|nr:acyl carrier protein [Nitrospinota bacterium]